MTSSEGRSGAMVTRRTSQAARVCGAILGQVEECLAGEWRAIVVRDTDESDGDGAVNVCIRPAEVEGCRADVAAALVGAHAALVGLAGLAQARASGQRVVAQVDALDVIATCQGDGLARLICPRGDQAEGAAADRVLRAPEVVRCLDGYVGVHAPTDEDRRLLDALTDGEDVKRWAAQRRRNEIVEAGQLWRLPVVPVLSPPELTAGQPFRFTWTGAPRRPISLSGLRVLDLGMVWSGPYSGRLLGGLGARVIKVEGPQRPDGTRRADERACQGAFADLNRGKASLVVDLSRAEGRDVLLRLVRAADVLIENFSPRVMPNFGLDFDALARVNPNVVMLSMPAFADTGGVAYGSGLELAAGLVGWDDAGRPRPSEVAYLDYLAGCYGAVGVLAALLRGGGAHVTVAQREVAAQVLLLGGGRQHRQAGMAVDLTLLAEAARRSGLLAGDRTTCCHYTRLPFQLAGLPHRYGTDAPRFGADTREVLGEQAGLSTSVIDRLFASGVVR